MKYLICMSTFCDGFVPYEWTENDGDAFRRAEVYESYRDAQVAIANEYIDQLEEFVDENPMEHTEANECIEELYVLSGEVVDGIFYPKNDESNSIKVVSYRSWLG